MKVLRAAATLVFAIAALACAKEEAVPATTPEKPELSPDEATSIAEEAYVYAFPMLESYRRLYAQAIDRTDPTHVGPFNELFHAPLESASAAPSSRLRAETLHSRAWLDLRAQPMVLSVPAARNRYYSVQCVDLFGQSFAYAGTRTTGSRAGAYVIAGPEWEGVAPAGASAVFRSESNFVLCVIRVGLGGSEDLDSASRLQSGFAFSTMSNFVGAGGGPDAAGITFPAYDSKRAESAAFIDLFNFLLKEVTVPEEERELFARFAAIGVDPGALAASLGLVPKLKAAIDAGVAVAIGKIAAAAGNPGSLDGVRVRRSNGWRGVDGLFGEGRRTPADYLSRAVAAKLGLERCDSDEIERVSTAEDALGEPLDAGASGYVLRFDKRALPKTEAFWSVALYSPPSRRFVRNPGDIYAVLDRSRLRYGKDGSLTVYIQRERPGPKRSDNWLPAPPGPFSLEISSYAPAREASSPPYVPPPLERAR